jgi:hypothetical protein
MPTIPAVVISKTLLPQSNIMAAFVHNHSNIFSDVRSELQTYKKPNVTQFAAYSVQSLAADLLRLLPKTSNYQHYNTLSFPTASPQVAKTLFNPIRNYECQVSAK